MEARKCSLRLLNFASGISLVVLFVYFFISPDISAPIDVIVPVYYLLFGLLIILSECELKYVDEKFKFLKRRVGRGLFMVLVGGMALRSIGIVNFIVAGVNIANGVITWSWREPEEAKDKYSSLQ